MAGLPAVATPLLSLGSKPCANARPGLWPAVGARYGAQCHQWIDVSARPVHAAALESRLDHELVRAFSAAAANRIAGGLKRRVLHLGQALVKYATVRSRASVAAVGSSARWIGSRATAESTCRAPSAACLSVCACSSSHAFNSGVAVPSAGWAAAVKCSMACGKSRMRTASGRSTSTNPCSHSAPSCTALSMANRKSLLVARCRFARPWTIATPPCLRPCRRRSTLARDATQFSSPCPRGEDANEYRARSVRR
jgi:hypothetical protein